jgi:hypothetical protein
MRRKPDTRWPKELKRPIANCGWSTCPKFWHKLEGRSPDDVSRYCRKCLKTVKVCTSIEVLKEAVLQGNIVAVSNLEEETAYLKEHHPSSIPDKS